jgi:hypothetical protein
MSDLTEFTKLALSKPPTWGDETFGNVAVPIFYETQPQPRGWGVYLRDNGAFEENYNKTMRDELVLMLYKTGVIDVPTINKLYEMARQPYIAPNVFKFLKMGR